MTSTAELSNRTLESALEEVVASFTAANPRSLAAHRQACRSMPGGNTRTILHYAPFPVTIRRGDGAYVEDLDGHRYVNYQSELSAGLFGHSNPQIRAAIREALDDGIVLSGPNVYEARLAAMIEERFPSVELLRFCNSGTEANIMAFGLARLHTGRDAILVFEGGYHGGVMSYSHGGSPLNLPFPTVVAPYNDEVATLALIEAHRDRLAAVALEPMMGGGGNIPADPAFLASLREVTRRHGIVLIFDEVMTSRLGYGGLQERYGVRPDLTSFGKYIGGGLTFGAFGGRADIMRPLDPTRPGAVLHGGTYNNSVLTMAAGCAGLGQVLTRTAVESLNERGERLRADLLAVAAKAGVPLQVTGVGSLLCLHPQARPIHRTVDVVADPRARRLLHLGLMNRGIYIATRGAIALSLEIGEPEMAGFTDALEDLLASCRGAFLAADR